VSGQANRHYHAASEELRLGLRAPLHAVAHTDYNCNAKALFYL